MDTPAGLIFVGEAAAFLAGLGLPPSLRLGSPEVGPEKLWLLRA